MKVKHEVGAIGDLQSIRGELRQTLHSNTGKISQFTYISHAIFNNNFSLSTLVQVDQIQKTYNFRAT